VSGVIRRQTGATTDAADILIPNGNDLDDDGDTEELILLSDGVLGHMQSSGPTGHTHRTWGMTGGMMFGHMGG
jgi:hypothetical protein